jgi:hypothetical protein
MPVDPALQLILASSAVGALAASVVTGIWTSFNQAIDRKNRQKELIFKAATDFAVAQHETDKEFKLLTPMAINTSSQFKALTYLFHHDGELSPEYLAEAEKSLNDPAVQAVYKRIRENGGSL